MYLDHKLNFLAAILKPVMLAWAVSSRINHYKAPCSSNNLAAYDTNLWRYLAAYKQIEFHKQ